MVYRFGTCLLDPQRHRLLRGGQAVRLWAKAFQLLCYLLEHRDRAVLKAELYEAIWPQSFISEATLESTLRAVRQAVGDTGRASSSSRRSTATATASSPPWKSAPCAQHGG